MSSMFGNRSVANARANANHVWGSKSRIQMRRTIAAVMRSKNIVIAVLFMVAMAVIFVVLWRARSEVDGLLYDLYTVASGMPVLGILIAVLGVLIYVHRQRRVVLEVDEYVTVRHSGARFFTHDLAAIQLFSVGHRSFIRVVPQHMKGASAGTDLQKMHKVAEVQSGTEQYTVEYLPGMSPKPYEFAEIIKIAYPQVVVEKLGSLRVV